MRRILVVTSGRADATPLDPVVSALLRRQASVEMVSLEECFLSDCCGSASAHLSGFAPDLMLVLGDRYEMLAACLAATVAKVPIAHIHGGEITRGSFDNQIRDAITKLSHVHFVATFDAWDRVAHELGEYKPYKPFGVERIHLVGAPGLDNLTDLPPRVPTKTFVLTYHPATLGENAAPAIVEALQAFPDYEVIWTGVNNDPGSDEVRKAFSHYRERKLTAREYHLACRQAACVIGNSSSGIIECPTIGVPTVNVGSRQYGREQGPSIFNASDDADDIVLCINRALSYSGAYQNPYGGPGASKKIADVLTSIELEGLLNK